MPSEKAFMQRKKQLCVISAFKPISHNHHGDILNVIKHTGVLPCAQMFFHLHRTGTARLAILYMFIQRQLDGAQQNGTEAGVLRYIF